MRACYRKNERTAIGRKHAHMETRDLGPGGLPAKSVLKCVKIYN